MDSMLQGSNMDQIVNNSQIKSVMGAANDPLLRSGIQFAGPGLDRQQSITTGVYTNDAYRSPANGGAFVTSAATSNNDMGSSMEGVARVTFGTNG